MSEGTFSYDEVPYESYPYPASHPARLAVLGTLFGMSPAPVPRCRVLELACASGGNLAPMAAAYPEAEFVGIDLSARQIADGQQIIEKAGLKNIELRHLSIMDVDESFGQFDYILAHGVFSWVPAEVQAKILEICKRNLAPQGVAYVSYNTYPGWHMRGAVRDMILFHVRGVEDPAARIKQARALVKFLAKSVTAEKAAYGYGQMLKDELELLAKVSDSYVLHELLEDVNAPVYFYQFVEMLNRHELQYLGEASFNSMLLENYPSKIVETLKPAIQDQVQLEQYLDFLTNRTFRSTLLCHAHVTLDRNLTPTTLQRVHIASPSVPTVAEPDIRSDVRVEFRMGQQGFGSREPLVKAAFLLLGKAWPQSILFTTLLEEARALAGDTRSFEESVHVLGSVFWQCVSRNVISLQSGPIPAVSTASERPMASPLARLQAETQPRVTSQRHETVTLDRYAQICLRLLDGTRDYQAILDGMMEASAAQRLQVRQENVPVTDPEGMRRVLGEQLPRCLEQLAKAGLLIK